MKRMLFNATQAEELRVAIVDGQKLVDIDIETAGREQRKSNIYKGVITRIEPSLEACFVNYGEDRHGFLSFKDVSRSFFREGVNPREASIKEALREGQEIIVQVEKEERGNKGAALTTFVSLAGRYLVLMPNNPRGGGVSRRVEGEDRQELREALDQVEVPEGMSIIARTAAIGRSAEELRWDLNYLLQLWTAIESASKENHAPILIYLESSLVVRAIRDYFQPDIGEILVDTDEIFEQAKSFMSVVMPDLIGRVKRYHDDVPLFSRFQIEHQIETAYAREVRLPSGGAIVIDHTEALVAIDVNSARSTRGGDIETTAFNTNMEAAEEAARQLRLRDLGGLIVIDFIDMEAAKNQREVEQRLKDALRVDRARVQMGKISRFGLMELSRQRLRPSLSEGSHVTCPRCNGTGVIRDTDSSALHVLRIIQEEAMKENTAAVHCQVPIDVAAFLLNEKRAEISAVEARHKVEIVLIPNKHLETPHHTLERLRHDDTRLENGKASYELAVEPEQTSYAKREEREAKPRQEAVVKGVLPEQPAPSAPAPAPVAEVVAVEAPRPVAVVTTMVRPVPAPQPAGLIGRIFGWFRGSAPEPVPAPQPVPGPAPAPVATATPTPTREVAAPRERNGQPPRDGRGRRERGAEGEGQRREPRTAEARAGEPRNGEARNVEGRNGNRPERGPRAEREPRADRGEREPRVEGAVEREARPEREPRVEGARPEREGQPGREPRGDRGRRGERRPRTETAEAGEATPVADAALTAAITTAAVTAAVVAPAVAPVEASAPEVAATDVATGAVAADAGLSDEAAAAAAEAREGEVRRRRRGRRGGRGRGDRRDGAEGGEGFEGEDGVAPTAELSPAQADALELAHGSLETGSAPIDAVAAHEAAPEAVQAVTAAPVAVEAEPVVAEAVMAAVPVESAAPATVAEAAFEPGVPATTLADAEVAVPAPAVVTPLDGLGQTDAANSAPVAVETPEPVAPAPEAAVVAEPVTEAVTAEAAIAEPPVAPAFAEPAAEPVATAEPTAIAPAEAAPAEAAPIEAAPAEAAPVDVAPVAAEPVAVVPAVAETPAVEPVAVSAPTPAVKSVDSLRTMLVDAGMTLVETDNSKLAAASAVAQPALVRPARQRKPVTPIDSGPLELVETRGNDQSPPQQ